jgi:hypothetical protein
MIYYKSNKNTMNPVLIILGVVIAILIYVLYRYFTVRSTTIQSSASLKTPVTQITDIQSPTSTRYAYGIWVYINSWDINANKTIFSRKDNLILYLDKSSPTLKLDMFMSNSTSATPVKETLTITDNFPIQKWCYVIVSVDNQFADVYIDGKLVKSKRFYTVTGSGSASTGNMPKTPGDITVPVFLGNSDVTIQPFTSFDAYVAMFKRWTGPIDPQTAWSTYMAGNGGNSLTKTLSSYGVNVAILKDNVVQSKFALL